MRSNPRTHSCIVWPRPATWGWAMHAWIQVERAAVHFVRRCRCSYVLHRAYVPRARRELRAKTDLPGHGRAGAPAAGDNKGMQPRWIAGPLRALLLRPAAAAAAGVASTATASAPAWAGFIGHVVLCLPPIPGRGIRLPRRPRAASKGPAF